MNQIPRRDRYSEEENRIREIVERHALPDFVTGFDVRLGDIEGDPAMWIVFRTDGDLKPNDPELPRWIAEIHALETAIKHDVFTSDEERFPYFRFEPETSMDALKA